MSQTLDDGTVVTNLVDGEQPEMLACFGECAHHGFTIFRYVFTLRTPPDAEYKATVDICACGAEGCTVKRARMR